MSTVDPVFSADAAGPGAARPDAGGRPQRPAVATIPERGRLDGPVATARLRRSAASYLLLCGAGLALAWLAAAPFWQAFGLGLVLPGGGFAAHLAGGAWGVAGGLAGIGLSLLLFCVALFAWFGSGNVLAPVVVWLGMALLAGALAPRHGWSGAPWLLAAAVAALGITVARSRARQRRAALRDRDRRNVHLSRLAARPAAADGALPEVAELSAEAAGYLRHLLDLSLQPLDEFKGFYFIDQFQTAAVRYQLCGTGYALATVQYGNLPAFRGYLSQAQRNLHDKMLDHRIWKYWQLENAWGRLRLDPDPIPNDNIMYSGWYGALLAEYISNTGDRRYCDEPFVLRHRDGRQWQYTFHQLVEILHRNFKASRFTLFPCEPNWIYPMCNNFGAISLMIHDRLFGTGYWADIETDYRQRFEDEFMTLDGRALAIRSAHTGLTIAALTSAMADCFTAHFLHGVMPDLARRSWEIARLDFIRLAGDGVELVTRGWDAIDTGNYRKSMSSTYAQVGAAAAEMGDAEVAERLRQRLRSEFRHLDHDGATELEQVSPVAHSMLVCLFSQPPGTRRNIHARGMPVERLHGPLLTAAPYPDALVTRACNDGGVLDLVLRPGRPGARGKHVTLELGQLEPGRRYVCSGALDPAIIADTTGAGRLRVSLDERNAVRVSPVD
ncbi:MAG: hypothetical protein ISP90_12470 [Nevskia sp.]|nr:hypothetical protein [Nevskia sp.]